MRFLILFRYKLSGIKSIHEGKAVCRDVHSAPWIRLYFYHMELEIFLNILSRCLSILFIYSRRFPPGFPLHKKDQRRTLIHGIYYCALAASLSFFLSIGFKKRITSTTAIRDTSAVSRQIVSIPSVIPLTPGVAAVREL